MKSSVFARIAVAVAVSATVLTCGGVSAQERISGLGFENLDPCTRFISSGFDQCDGLDNDCDGTFDEDAVCKDGKACTTDICVGILGCEYVVEPGATCLPNASCDPGGWDCQAAACDASSCTVPPNIACDPCTGCYDPDGGSAYGTPRS